MDAEPPERLPLRVRLGRLIFGAPRDIHDPGVFHKISLIAFLAWVGLGADPLSSSAYGPEEAFRKLGAHVELAVFLALATALTVFVISYGYSRIIDRFPSGGGGYVVATKLLGSGFGVVSGCALLVDYVLTITTSIAGGADATFSFLPMPLHPLKLPLEGAVIGLMIVMNLRGVKESVSLLAPIFILFLVTHAVLLIGAFATHAHQIPVMASRLRSTLAGETLGAGALFLIFLRAYSYGAGTYTGIEAVSNGIQIMREPKVQTAKRTMVYLAVSLAVVAGGILIGYLLLGVTPEEGKTLNAVLIERVGFGAWFVVLTLVAESALLFVAGQAGFIDGPRVMANMALDSWLPHRFSSLSDRLTMHYGVLLMGAASVAMLLYTRGNITALVTMYAINVFITFSLSQMGMLRLAIKERGMRPDARRSFWIHLIGLMLCLFILAVVVIEKFEQGAWITLVVTLLLIGVCWLIRAHYRTVASKLDRLTLDLGDLAAEAARGVAGELDPRKPTAVLLVAGYGGLGIHSLLNIFKMFPKYFDQVVFLSVSVIDSGSFKGAEEVAHLEARTREDLDRYVGLARSFGLAASSITSVGTEPAAEAERLCAEVVAKYPRATFFAGQLVFQREKWYQRLLHNETAFTIQRRLQWEGHPMVILPVRVRG
jgi:amino acid transporter